KLPLEEKDVARALEATRGRWACVVAAPATRFPSARWPLLHVSAHRECELSAVGFRDFAVGLDCDADADGDGVPLRRDCDDGRADVRPGAVDLPGDGVDEDCSGADA